MLFPTLEFTLFFLIVFVANWLLRPQDVPWRVAMLGASLFFYGWWNWKFVLLLGGSILVNWYFGDHVARAHTAGSTARAGLVVKAAVGANLLLLGVFKYYGFFTEQFRSSFGVVGELVPLVEITLPVGISFFTFQAMSYVIDIHRRHIEPMSLLDVGVYLSFFPQLVAGPIVRASEFAPQLRTHPDPRAVPTAEAFRLIFAGLFKKVVISTYLASEIVDEVFNVPDTHSGPELLFAVYAYAIQIYADFSGYTDIAIGVALLMGFRFPQNFDAPYRSLSIQEFWRRWHMTLSNWLRDYLYIPLGGNRRGTLFTYRNLILTMLLGGLWHGAAWNFVIWGAIHGGVLAVERIVSGAWRRRVPDPILPTAVSGVLRWLYTFHVVCFAWIFFRAETFDLATSMIGGIADWSGSSPLVTGLLVFTIGAMLASQFVPTGFIGKLQVEFGAWSWVAQGAALGVGIVLVDVLGPEGVAPFIYFQF
ncbi:MAG: MBOAT family protein [Actinomycetia bacterium]|nr:MBOAT family protein [Actinomycetes bacterium]MCP4959335.1 MBOAT family protein [Actinomycetes bacterium]